MSMMFIEDKSICHVHEPSVYMVIAKLPMPVKHASEIMNFQYNIIINITIMYPRDSVVLLKYVSEIY